MKVEVSKSPNPDKKYKIVLHYEDGRTKTVHIGQAGASDYTIHKDKERRDRYIERHRARENWTKSGIDTAGFWSKYLLWNKPTIGEAKKYIEKKFNLQIN
jgi:hypothetical protein